jgi:hypothetical protein
MATISRWNDDGVMTEEWLYWDNQTFMQQLGLTNNARRTHRTAAIGAGLSKPASSRHQATR